MAISSYDIAPLRTCDIEKSFPVAQMAHPALTLDRWRQQAAAALDIGDPRGILLATRNGYVYGLAAYRMDDAAQAGPAVEIEDMVAVDFVSAGWIYHRFLMAAERAARRAGCDRLLYGGAGAADDPALAEALAQCGLVEDGPHHAKHLPPADIHEFGIVAAAV